MVKLLAGKEADIANVATPKVCHFTIAHPLPDLMIVEMRVFHWSRLMPLNPFAWWRGSSSPIETPLLSQMASHSVLVEVALLESLRREVRRAIARRRETAGHMRQLVKA